MGAVVAATHRQQADINIERVGKRQGDRDRAALASESGLDAVNLLCRTSRRTVVVVVRVGLKRGLLAERQTEKVDGWPATHDPRLAAVDHLDRHLVLGLDFGKFVLHVLADKLGDLVDGHVGHETN